jgi:hypothetical protein
MLENANKVAYLIQEYPERNLTEIINLMEMPGVEINTAIWYATELGWISEPDKDEGAVRALSAPQKWEFGERIENLKDMLVYSFQKLAKKEQDLEENYLSNWTMGYATHDTMIAVRSLMKEGLLAQYTIEDDVQNDGSTYTFFTLAANRDKEWGRSQFKKKVTAPATDTPPADKDNIKDKQEE